MRKRLDRIIEESIRRLEAGASLNDVLAAYPDEADELRPHLEVWRSLSAQPASQPSAPGAARGMARLEAALTQQAQRGGANTMQDISKFGNLALRLAGGLAIVGGVVLGLAALSGYFSVHVGSGDSAQATGHECVLALDFNGDGLLDVQDVEVFKAAFGSSAGDANYDPRADVNGDGTVDLWDVVAAAQMIVDCMQQLQPALPPPPTGP
jgi:hypothetical protein